jgi:hypothetical protein
MPQHWTAEDRRIGKLMADYWVNFARTGNPNGPGLPHWPALNASAPRIMSFASKSRAIPAPREDAFQAIDAYYARTRAARAKASSAGIILNIDISGNGPDQAASVPDIAIDPREPKHIVAVWRTVAMALEPNPTSRRLVCHLSVSRDGGVSFTSEVIDWNMPETPICNAPYVDFGANGELFIGATLVEKGPLNPPQGYHAFGRAVIRKSADGGHIWAPTVGVIASDSLAKGKFAPDPSVPDVAKLTPWDGARGIVNRSNGDIYVAGGYPAPPGGDAHSQRFYSVSHDGGATWDDIRAMGSADWPQRWDGRIIAAPGKMALAYIAGAAPGTHKCLCVVFATSSDGGATLKRTLVTQVGHVDTLVHYPPLAADPGRPGAFAIALVSDDRAGLVIHTSSDDGATWTKTAPPSLPADVARVSRPAIAFTPGGTLVAMWRDQHADGSYDVYMAAAPDGAHFREPLRVSTASSRTPERLMSDYAVRGDFINVMKAGSDFMHAAWTDWRSTEEARVSYGRVPLSLLLDSAPDRHPANARQP